jgi:hypothetical protein
MKKIKRTHSGLGWTEGRVKVTTKGEAGERGRCCCKRALHVSRIEHCSIQAHRTAGVGVSNGTCHSTRASAAGVHTSCAQQTSGRYRVRALSAYGTARGIGTGAASGCVETPDQREAPVKRHAGRAWRGRALDAGGSAGDASERGTRASEGHGWARDAGGPIQWAYGGRAARATPAPAGRPSACSDPYRRSQACAQGGERAAIAGRRAAA